MKNGRPVISLLRATFCCVGVRRPPSPHQPGSAWVKKKAKITLYRDLINNFML